MARTTLRKALRIAPIATDGIDPYTSSAVFQRGTRVELSPACDLWMRGAKYGTVTQVSDNGGTPMVNVRMDHPSVKRIQRFTDLTLLRLA